MRWQAVRGLHVGDTGDILSRCSFASFWLCRNCDVSGTSQRRLSTLSYKSTLTSALPALKVCFSYCSRFCFLKEL